MKFTAKFSGKFSYLFNANAPNTFRYDISIPAINLQTSFSIIVSSL